MVFPTEGTRAQQDKRRKDKPSRSKDDFCSENPMSNYILEPKVLKGTKGPIRSARRGEREGGGVTDSEVAYRVGWYRISGSGIVGEDLLSQFCGNFIQRWCWAVVWVGWCVGRWAGGWGARKQIVQGW